MNEDVMKILKMIESGTISAEDGMRLIDAVSSGTTTKKQSDSLKSPKTIRVYIEDMNKKENLDIKLPFAIFKAGLKIGGKFSPEVAKLLDELDQGEILKSVEDGNRGEITRVTTSDGHVIKIYAE